MHYSCISECESVRSGTPVKLDDVSGYGTADSCSDKTPPYLPTNRLQQQQTFDTICRDDGRNDFSVSCRSGRVSIFDFSYSRRLNTIQKIYKCE